MNPISEKLFAFAKHHWLPLLVGGIGLLFLIFGLQTVTSKRQDAVTIDLSTTDVVEASASGNILVDVSGAVARPGVQKLSTDARIQDAISAAGGLSESADINWVAKSLNLAAKLTDGSKLYIPYSGEQAPASSSFEQSSTGQATPTVLGSTTGGINVNTASASQLESLSGVGVVTAQKIIDGRPYTSLDELVSKKIITKKVYEKIKNSIAL